MATQLIDEKKFVGGVFGTANNIANYCNNVSVLSISNNNKNERSFILEKISKKIDTKFFYIHQIQLQQKHDLFIIIIPMLENYSKFMI